jgi:hypothetical protein
MMLTPGLKQLLPVSTMKVLADTIVKVESEKRNTATDLARIPVRDIEGKTASILSGYMPNQKVYAGRMLHETESFIKQAVFFPTLVGSYISIL